MANSPNTTRPEAVRRALESARNTVDGQVDPRANAVLEAAINEVWRNIQSQPDSYILNRDEFALFNYFRDRFRNSPVAQQAVERFWNNFRGNPSDIDGYVQRRSGLSGLLYYFAWDQPTNPPKYSHQELRRRERERGGLGVEYDKRENDPH